MAMKILFSFNKELTEWRLSGLNSLGGGRDFSYIGMHRSTYAERSSEAEQGRNLPYPLLLDRSSL